ncbi:MAG: dihydrolipoyl dehydrogenase [Candidatus Omnitrophica bacterium]|nr:dihydrolipoyl dehydrogenase [Candidatus Omnitrophota bacterium]
MAENSYDIAILGGGPGGYVAALYGAQCEQKVCLIEGSELGGTCLNRGCIPTKSILSSTEINTNKDLKGLIEDKDKIVATLRGGIASLLKARKVDLVQGFGKIKSPGVITVDSKTINAKSIIIATGSSPVELPNLLFDHKKILSSDDLLVLTKRPESLLIVGGGVIGCEFATIFNRLGTKVTIVEMMDHILPGLDKELAQRLTSNLKRRGIVVKTGTKVNSLEDFPAESVLVCVGRRPNSKGIGLDALSIKTERGKILVDDRLRTSAKGVYAIGDVIGGYLLAHVASHEGLVAVDNIIGKDKRIDYKAVPNCIYTDPEIATVGIGEDEAKKSGVSIKSAKFPYMGIGKAHAIGKTEGFFKIIASADTDKVLGVEIMGAHATDLIAEAALAVKLGATVEDLKETIHAHPTLAEGLMEAAHKLHGKPIHGV